MEWQAWKGSLCDGCGHPVAETFDPAMEDRYRVEVVACHACAARERKARIMNNPDNGDPVPGLRYVVTPEED